MPTKKILKKNNNITKKNKQSGGAFGNEERQHIKNKFSDKAKEMKNTIKKVTNKVLNKEREVLGKEKKYNKDEIVEKAKKGLDKYKKGDFLYKLSEEANKGNEHQHYIKNNLYYLTIGKLQNKDTDTHTDINTKINNFEIFDHVDLIENLNDKQKATLKANLFLLSLSDLKFDMLNKSDQTGGGNKEVAENLAKNVVGNVIPKGIKGATKTVLAKKKAPGITGNVIQQAKKRVVERSEEIKNATEGVAGNAIITANNKNIQDTNTPGEGEPEPPEERITNKPLKRQDGVMSLDTRPELPEYLKIYVEEDKNYLLKEVLLQQNNN